MEEIFFSFTFGGETLSLAAALATMTKLQREPVVETLYKQGKRVMGEVGRLIGRHGVGDFASICGNPTWSFLVLKDIDNYTQGELKTFLMQEMLSRGILTFGTHNISYSHSDADLDVLFAAYDDVLAALGDVVRTGTLREKLRCDALQPLFKVR